MNAQIKQQNALIRLVLIVAVSFFGFRAMAQSLTLPVQCNAATSPLTKYMVNSQDSLYTAIRTMKTTGAVNGRILIQLTQGFQLTQTFDQWMSTRGGPAAPVANQISFMPSVLHNPNVSGVCLDGRGFRITLGWTQIATREYRGLPLFNEHNIATTSLDVMRPAINTYLPWWDFASMLLYPQYKSASLFSNKNQPSAIIDRVNLSGFLGVLKNDYTNSDAIDAGSFALENYGMIQKSSASMTMNAVRNGGCLVRDNTMFSTAKIIDTRINCQVNAHIDGSNGLVFGTNKGTMSGIEARGTFQAYELRKNAQGQFVEMRSKVGAIHMYKLNQGALSIKVAAHPAVMKQQKTAWGSMQDVTPTAGPVAVKELGLTFNYSSGINSASYSGMMSGKAVLIQILRQ